jgi:tellurite resistance protein TehA-like permease
MSTGSLSVVLSNTPNKFPGLTVIGTIFFILNLVLFGLFTIAMGLRAFWFPKRFLNSLHHPVEGLFFGSYWVSVSLILNATQGYGVSKSGPWLVTALRVCFWIYCAVVLVVAVAQYYILFQVRCLPTSQFCRHLRGDLLTSIARNRKNGSKSQTQSRLGFSLYTPCWWWELWEAP